MSLSLRLPLPDSEFPRLLVLWLIGVVVPAHSAIRSNNGSAPLLQRELAGDKEIGTAATTEEEQVGVATVVVAPEPVPETAHPLLELELEPGPGPVLPDSEFLRLLTLWLIGVVVPVHSAISDIPWPACSMSRCLKKGERKKKRRRERRRRRKRQGEK